MKSNHRHDERSRMIAMALTMLAALFMTAGVAVPAQAQTPTVLHSFNDGTLDACAPRGNIVQGRDGNMYGGGALPAELAATRRRRDLQDFSGGCGKHVFQLPAAMDQLRWHAGLSWAAMETSTAHAKVGIQRPAWAAFSG